MGSSFFWFDSLWLGVHGASCHRGLFAALRRPQRFPNVSLTPGAASSGAGTGKWHRGHRDGCPELSGDTLPPGSPVSPHLLFLIGLSFLYVPVLKSTDLSLIHSCPSREKVTEHFAATYNLFLEVREAWGLPSGIYSPRW